MAIIYSFPYNEEILPSDILVGTSTKLYAGKPKNETKNFNISSITYYVNSFNTLDLVLQRGNESFRTANIGALGLWENNIDNGDGSSGSYGYITLDSEDSMHGIFKVVGGGFETPVLFQTSDNGIVSFKNEHFNPTFDFSNTSDTRTYTWQDDDGVVAFLSDIPSVTGYVPYTGATGDVELGTHTIRSFNGTSGIKLTPISILFQQDTDTGILYMPSGYGGNWALPEGTGTLALTSDITSISLTTTGSSGSSTLISNVLNVPTYTLSGLGGEPTIAAGTTSQYWRGDKTWQTFPTIPSITGLVPYTGATGDVDLGNNDMYLAKLWLYDEPNGGYGSVHLTDGVFHVEDIDGHSMITFEDQFFTFAKTSTIRALLDLSNLTVNRDYLFPDASGTIALTSQIPTVTPSALTKTDDTNVTLTLGGSPSTALLAATSLTLSWTGTLADSRITSAATWNSKQAGSTNLTSLSALAYASTSFVKMTAAGTFALDTNTYLTSVGTGTTNQLTYWSGTNTLGSLTTATYPSLTELSYVKGVTSSIQTQLGTKLAGVHTLKVLPAGQSTTLSINGTTITTASGIANRITLLPYIPNVSFTSANLYINVSTLLLTANARILIYSDVNGVPTTKLYESANLDCSTIGIKTATTAFSFVAGTTYWLAVHSSSTPIYSAYNISQIIPFSASGTVNYISYISSQTFGSAPTTLTGATLSSVVPTFIAITF
jgi:hypothetical protein